MKQTSDRVSRLAARVLASMQTQLEENGGGTFRGLNPRHFVNGAELATLCASCLGQDETKGQRKKRRK